MGTTKYRTTDISILQDFGRDKHGLSEHSGIQVTSKLLKCLRKLLDLRVLILVDTLAYSLYSTCHFQVSIAKTSGRTIKPRVHIILDQKYAFSSLFQNLGYDFFKSLPSAVKSFYILCKRESSIYGFEGIEELVIRDLLVFYSLI